MLYETLAGDDEDASSQDSTICIALDIANDPNVVITHKTMTTLAIAASIDAMASGPFKFNPSQSLCILCSIAVVTGIFSLSAYLWASNQVHG